MRAVRSTIGDDIRVENDIQDLDGIESDDSTRGAQSNQECQMGDDLQSQVGSDAAWDEVEYKVYGDFQESDRYQSSEQMAVMREDDSESEYEMAHEEVEEEESHIVKYMTTRDFGEVPDGSPIYQYQVHVAQNHRNSQQDAQEGMVATDEEADPKDHVRHMKLRVAKQPQA